MIPLRMSKFLNHQKWKNDKSSLSRMKCGFPLPVRGNITIQSMCTTSRGKYLFKNHKLNKIFVHVIQKKEMCTSKTYNGIHSLCYKFGMNNKNTFQKSNFCVEERNGLLNLFNIFKRFKMVKTSSYRRKSRSSPNGQGQKAKIGVKRLSAEYVKTGQLLVKQRKIIAFNYEKKTRKRNFKYYPGEHVKVTKNTSLVALTNGRVKYTFHVLQNVLIVNVLPEELDELKEEDLYRYRTEHVKSFEENRSLIYLRMKHVFAFPKNKHTQFIKPPLKPQFLTKYDIYDNPTLREVPVLYHKRE
ncbi:hypothetical protein, conserved [Plasmodium gonderi]|uniref:Mitochondrial ribosomal protein L27 n=1 Tax=Plasmodium gonderi TaxID=77519 RepID=A0A1Y1JIN5_PLAGO|nr:hypothetical protein, conserved [Plasmodium gonderi]GAW80662.1 hypothetical protein, conserved [Plasmodium gonderi]